VKRIAVAVVLVVAAVGLVACGGGSSTSSAEEIEAAEGVVLFHEWQRLSGLPAKGIHRLSMALEYGTKQEAESLEEVVTVETLFSYEVRIEGHPIGVLRGIGCEVYRVMAEIETDGNLDPFAAFPL